MRQDCLMLSYQLLAIGFIGKHLSSEYITQRQETCFSETFANVSQHVMCFRAFMMRLWIRYKRKNNDSVGPLSVSLVRCARPSMHCWSDQHAYYERRCQLVFLLRGIHTGCSTKKPAQYNPLQQACVSTSISAHFQ